MTDLLAERVETLRAFNRFWTAHIGVLRSRHLDTPYSLTEARILFELAQHDVTELADLRMALQIDAGYFSRIVARFRAAHLVTTEASSRDARRQLARLTTKGRRAFELLDARSVAQMKESIGALSEDDQQRLTAALGTAHGLFAVNERPRSYLLRAPRAGEYGWIVQRHGAIYSDEFGWDARFEGLVAEIVGAFATDHDALREAAWIAEVDGAPAGCVLCVRKSAKVAQLRLLLVDPRARGLGIGARLIDECIAFARKSGYAELVLWTNDVLKDARRLYERAGFELVQSERHESFGKRLVGQNWKRSLRQAP